MAELKPCPFCGGTDIRFSVKKTGRAVIEYAPGKKGKCWFTTELTTGYRMDRRTNTTMNDALNEVREFINSGRLAAVLPRVLADLPAGHNVNSELVPDYTVWTVHTAKTA